MNQIALRPLPHLTADDVLVWPGVVRKHHARDDPGYPRLPADRRHPLNRAGSTRAHRGRLCPYEEIIGALNASTNVRVPDLVVTAAPDERGQQTVADPVLLVEVPSPGKQDDTRDNVRAYATLPSVREIAVLHSTRLLAEVDRRDPTGNWLPDPDLAGPGDRLRLPSVGLDCPIEDVYRGTWLLRRGRPG